MPSSVQPVHLDDAVTLKDGKESANEQMLAVCRKALPGWEQLTVADVQVGVLLADNRSSMPRSSIMLWF